MFLQFRYAILVFSFFFSFLSIFLLLFVFSFFLLPFLRSFFFPFLVSYTQNMFLQGYRDVQFVCSRLITQRLYFLHKHCNISRRHLFNADTNCDYYSFTLHLKLNKMEAFWTAPPSPTTKESANNICNLR